MNIKSMLHANYTWKYKLDHISSEHGKIRGISAKPSLKQTAGSVVSLKPAQSALRTAPLSSFPEKHMLG
jgi:hypothetical protein